MKIKHFVGIFLIVCGLFVALGSFGRMAPTEVTQKINGEKIVLRNSSNQHGNWQLFLGLSFLGLGMGIASIPSPELVERTK